MLLSQTDDRSNALGWAIIDDMVRDNAYTPEQETYLDTMRAYRSEFSSLGRNDINWAPYRTKTSYVDSLELYYEQMTIYKVNILIQILNACNYGKHNCCCSLNDNPWLTYCYM